MGTKKSNPTRVWHARNLVSVAAKMTSSSIEPCRLCRSATVTQYRYRASLYLVTIHFCESTKILAASDERDKGHRKAHIMLF